MVLWRAEREALTLTCLSGGSYEVWDGLHVGNKRERGARENPGFPPSSLTILLKNGIKISKANRQLSESKEKSHAKTMPDPHRQAFLMKEEGSCV